MWGKNKNIDVLKKHTEYSNDGKNSSADWDKKNSEMMDMLKDNARKKDKKGSGFKWFIILAVIAFVLYILGN